MNPKRVVPCGVYIGADPELFLSKKADSAVVGSEKVVPTSGLAQHGYETYCTVTRDGVQVEFHPGAHHCRESMNTFLQRGFMVLRDEVIKHPDLQIDFTQVVKVSREELDSLLPENQILGCNRSFNVYGDEPVIPDGREMLMRSAAGHIHLGNLNSLKQGGALEPAKLIPVLDLMVGIPGVLLDRDPAQAERRQFYGRAGEFRTPPHGVEYRTLSNFWLRHNRLSSLMFAQAKNACNLLFTSTLRDGYGGYTNLYSEGYQELIGKADPQRVQEAINRNDFDMAKSLFDEVVRPVIEKMDTGTGLNARYLPSFDKLVKEGIDAHFPKDNDKILTGWLNYVYGSGWEKWAEAGCPLTK